MAEATKIEQAQVGSGAIRDKPITRELEALLDAAATAADIDRVVVTSGGQPGTKGERTGSTRHDGGRAADLHLVVAGRTLKFSDTSAPFAVRSFVAECARRGALGIGAGIAYMGDNTIHVGFGQTPTDTTHVVWGAGGKSVNAPQWLRDAATAGWMATAPVAAPVAPVPPPRPAPEPQRTTTEQGATAALAGSFALAAWAVFGWIGVATVVVAASVAAFYIIRAKRRAKRSAS